MSNQIDLKPIKEKLDGNGSVFVLFGQHATIDHVAASLSLFLTLKNQGKDVLIASPAELRAEFSRLVGLDKIGKSIGNRNLVIAFNDYDPGSIEKVSHNDGQGNAFELIIEPKTGFKAPDPKNIDFSYRGAHADLVFLVGTARLEDLGSIYESERNLFQNTTTVAFNRRQSPSFAAISIVDTSASALSEIIAEFIDQLGFKAKDDVASNLLAGIDFATNRFQNPMISPNAFLTAGKLLQNGARRHPPRITSASQMTGDTGLPGFQPFTPGKTDPASFARSMAANTPTHANPSQAAKSTPNPKTQNPQKQASNDKTPPKEWLKPKIYKGSTRV